MNANPAPLLARLFAAALGLVLAAATQAQNPSSGTIEGRVLNAATGQYLRNAQVEVAGTDRVATAGEAGVFTLSNVPAGTVRLAVVYPGLDRLEQEVLVTPGQVARPEIGLTSSTYGDGVVKMSGFLVAAEREGNAKAIVEQKVALNVKTVIAADAFGDISEGNIGEFLKLLPGISVDYVENDVRTVRVRGLSPKYANVTLDGHPIATSASSSIDTGRQFEFEQVSLATIETVEINKTPTADMPASSLSGNVNVVSKTAFGQKGRMLRYSLNATINDYTMTLRKTTGWDNKERSKVFPGGSLEFSDTFWGGRLGVVAAVNHSGSYVEQKIYIPSYTFDRNPNNNLDELPVIQNFNLQDGLKPTWRTAGVVNLDYRASDALTLSLRTSYNWYDAPFHNRNWVIAANNTGLAFNADGTVNPASLTGLANRTPTSATSLAPAANNTNTTAQMQGSNLRKYGGTFITSPALRWRSGNVEFDAGMSYSQSRNWYDSVAEGFLSQVVARMPGVNWQYDVQGDTGLQIRQVSSPTANNTSILDLANYTNNVSVNAEERNSKDQIWTANADLKLDLDNFARPVTVKFGGDTRLNVRDIQNFNPSWTVNTGAGGINLANYRDPYTPDFQKGERITDLNGVSGPAPSPDKWKLYELWRTYNTDPFATTTTAQQPFNANAAANLRNMLQNMYDIKEEIYSLYMMGTVEIQRGLTLIGGLRYENTETAGRAYDDVGPTRAAAISGTTNVNDLNYIQARFGNRITRTKSYDNLFPSFQIRYAPSRNVVLRGAYFASVLRPDFGNVVGGVGVNDAAPFQFTVRNTELEPETANNFDLRLEYYFEPVGVISAGVFFKDLKKIQVQTTSPIDPNAIPEAIAQLGFTSASLASATISQRQNAGNSSIWGIEVDYNQQLSFLPGVWRGLGVFANATYVNPENVRVFALTAEDGIPEYTANFGVSYRLRRFNGQLKGNWIDERVRQIAGITISPSGVITNNVANNSARTEYTGSRFQVDVNLNYELHRRATLFLNISNLFDEPHTRYWESRAFYARYGEFGTRYTLGVKGSF